MRYYGGKNAELSEVDGDFPHTKVFLVTKPPPCDRDNVIDLKFRRLTRESHVTLPVR